MADRKPLKVLPDGGGDSTGLGEFVAADTIGVVDGGTGLATVATSNILTGNGTSALSAESNLTFDGTVLTVTGTELVNSGSTKVIAEFTSSNTNRMIVVSADTETANDTAGIAFNATASQAVGSTHSIAAIEGKVTQAGTLKGDLIFHINAGDSYTERMRIHSDGLLRVIGTAASPSSANGAAGVAYFTGAASDSGIAVGSYASSPWDNWIQSQQENGTVSDIVMQPRGGYVGIGTVANNPFVPAVSVSGFEQYISNAHASGEGLMILLSGGAGDTSQAFLKAEDNSGSAKAIIWSNGDFDSATNSYGAVSDSKLKQDITDVRDYWDDFKAVKFLKFKFKSDVELHGEDAPSMLGVVAQELETVFPRLVSESPDTRGYDGPVLDAEGNPTYEQTEKLDDDGKVVSDDDGNAIMVDDTEKPIRSVHNIDLGTTTKSAKYSVLGQIGLCVIQELQTRLEAAEAKIATLESA